MPVLTHGPHLKGPRSHLSFLFSHTYLAMGVFLVGLYWVLESLIHVVVFGQGTLGSQFLTTDPHEIWKRLLVTSLLVLFSLFAQRRLDVQRHIEAALRNSEHRYRTLIHGAPNPILVLDAEGSVVEANDAAARFFERDPKTLVRSTLSALTGDHGTATDLAPSLPPELGEREFDIPLNGSSKTLLLSIAPIHIEAAPPLFFGIGLDITERKQIESRLELAYSELDQIFQTASSAMRLVDRGFRVLKVNRTFEELSGLPAAENVGATCRETFGNVRCGTDQCTLARVLAGDSEFECEAQITRRDGQRIDCLVAARPFLDRNGHTIGIVESFKDITELKASRAAAIRAEQLAAVGQLSAAVAHEINNPINGIINYGQLLNEPSHPHDVRDLGGRIVEEGERVAAIVETLLSFSRRTSKVKMPVSIAKVVRDTITLVGAQLKKDAITLQTDVPDDLPPVDCIPQEMQRVLLNLIDNARWALNQRYPDWHEDKILEITAAVPSCSVGDTEVLVSVHDHGTGIPKAALDKVMNPFFTTKPTGQGTGLGLSIVHDIVSEIGGHVTIASDEGVSTTIRLRLPTATRAAVEEAR